MNTTEPVPGAVAADVEPIWTVDADTPLLHARGVHSVSTDEVTGIPALERTAPATPLRPGGVERREVDYIRHGPRSAMVSCAVAPGHGCPASCGPPRTSVEFVAHVRATVATAPEASWGWVVDQLHMHQSMELGNCVAEQCGLAAEGAARVAPRDVGRMVSRTMLLSDPAHRSQWVDTPTHTSWLNQVEVWLGRLVRRVSKRGNVTPVAQLRARILASIADFNQPAKPFTWTWTGRPLVR